MFINTTENIVHPKVKPTMLAVPLAAGQFAIHRGTNQAGTNILINDPGGWRYTALGLMDGSRDLEQVQRELHDTGHVVSTSDVEDYVEDLVQQGAVADAARLSLDGLTEEEIQRYSRNLNGWAGLSSDGRSPGQLQSQLRDSHLVVFGVGGLGSSVALAMAMAGCGHLTLIDFDTVELSNLNRQQYTTDDIGRAKVDVMQERLKAINPNVRVDTMRERLMGMDHVLQILRRTQPDIAVATADRPTIAIDRWINDACFASGIPYVNTSVSAGTGMVFSKIPGVTGCFCCDELSGRDARPEHYAVRRYREQSDLIPATSAFSFTAMAVGAMIASEVTRYLVQWRMASAGRLVVLDVSTLGTTVTDKPAHPKCPICADHGRGPGRRVAAKSAEQQNIELVSS